MHYVKLNSVDDLKEVWLDPALPHFSMNFNESTLDIFMIHKSSMFFSNIDNIYILENSV